MIKLLYRLFKTRFNQLAFHSQRKSAKFAGAEQCFIDSKGNQYYRFLNDFDIPIMRKGALEKTLSEYQQRMGGGELDKFIQAMESALDDTVNTSGKGQIKGIARIGFLLEEIKRRKELIIEPDLLMELVGLLYIREDEDPAIVDDAIQIEKVLIFKEDSRGGLYDFFYQSGLKTYLPYLEQLKDGFESFAQEAMMMKMVQLEMLTSFLGETSSSTAKTDMPQ